MSAYTRRRYTTRGGTATAARVGRWMDLRYGGTCAVCRTALPVGTRAYYDPGDRSTTCYDLACCEANGLTEQKWHGSPTSGGYITAHPTTDGLCHGECSAWSDSA